MTPRSFGPDATRDALPFDRLIPALRRAFVDGAEVPDRHHHALPGDATLLLMPAWQARYLGVKLVTVHPGNPARGLPAVNGAYLLSDAGTGQPLATMDAEVLTARRTAAASALAAGFLAREDAAELLLVGAGRVAELVPAAYRVVRPIRRVRVWNRGMARADALVASLRADGFDAERADDLEAAVRRADAVSCATLSTEPPVRGAWLRPGTHLDLIGAFTPAMREADAEAVRRARVFVDTPAALHEAGELAGLAADEVGVQGTLADLCAGRVLGRAEAGEITLFKSVGTALEDLAAAVLVHETGQGAHSS